MLVACASHFWFDIGLVTFLAAAVALSILSKVMSDATEQLARYTGQRIAGFINVALSNLPELIIIFVAVRANMIGLVQAGIVGSIVGNLLLVMGCSIYFGCRKNGTLEFNADTATLFINQFVLVGVTLFLPSLFGSRIPEHRQQLFSNLLALMLAGAYVYYYVLSLRDPRFREIEEQSLELNHRWSKRFSTVALTTAAILAFVMSGYLVDEVEGVAKTFGFSESFLGFIVLPFLGNIAGHAVAVVAAVKRMTELSLSISVGAASQVGMIVAPAAVLFGAMTGNPVSLNFMGLPLDLLVITFIAAYVVLRDNRWNINEGVMLIAMYVAMVIAFGFCQ